MSVYHLRKWHRWQRASITSVARARKSRLERSESEVSVLDDYSMTFVCISTSLERDLCDVLSRDATIGKLIDAYLLRLLQYVARTSGVRGEIHLPARMWGPSIFTRPWDAISASKGKRILEAFRGVGIVQDGPAELPEWLVKFNGSSRDPSRDGKFARSTASASASASEDPPLPPPAAGGVNGKPRKREVQKLSRYLRYHAVVKRDPDASRMGSLLRKGEMDEPMIAEALQRFGNVSSAQLVNFEKNG